MNKLETLLYEIKVNENPYFVSELCREKQVNKIILSLCKRYKIRRLIIENLLKDYVLREYRYDSEYVCERFLNYAGKYLGRKVHEISGRK